MSQANPTIRGCVLVICNSFSDSKAERNEENADDVSSMKQLWGEELGCDSFSGSDSVLNGPDFKVHVNVKAQNMVNLLDEFSKFQPKIEYSYIAVVISTHGGLVAESWAEKWEPTTCASDNPSLDQKKGYDGYAKYGIERQTSNKYVNEKKVEVLFGNDFRPVKEKKIKELFYNKATPVWKGVPKIFILNYCRGDTVDNGVIRIPSSTERSNTKENSPKAYVEQPEDSDERVDMAELLKPRISDVLTVYATHHRYQAFGTTSVNKSWLLSTIAKVFKRYGRHMHVLDMLTFVNRDMKKKVGINDKNCMVKAMSIYESSLVKNLYLHHEAKKRAESHRLGECGERPLN